MPLSLATRITHGDILPPPGRSGKRYKDAGLIGGSGIAGIENLEIILILISAGQCYWANPCFSAIVEDNVEFVNGAGKHIGMRS